MTAETRRRLFCALLTACLLLIDASDASAQSIVTVGDKPVVTGPKTAKADVLVSRAKRRNLSPVSNGTGQTGGLPAMQPPGSPSGPGAPSLPPSGAPGGPSSGGGSGSGSGSGGSDEAPDATRDVARPIVVLSRPFRVGDAWLLVGRVVDARTGRPLAGELVGLPFDVPIAPERSNRRGFVVWTIPTGF